MANIWSPVGIFVCWLGISGLFAAPMLPPLILMSSRPTSESQYRQRTCTIQKVEYESHQCLSRTCEQGKQGKYCIVTPYECCARVWYVDKSGGKIVSNEYLPEYCNSSNGDVGAKRTCYYNDNGKIRRDNPDHEERWWITVIIIGIMIFGIYNFVTCSTIGFLIIFVSQLEKYGYAPIAQDETISVSIEPVIVSIKIETNYYYYLKLSFVINND